MSFEENTIAIQNTLVRELFSKNFWFNIPSYQRPYVWREDNINELLEDITYAFKNNPEENYFMGSLVLQSRSNNEYDILDGQQRLTTLALLLATIRDNIKDKDIIDSLAQTLYQKGDRTEKRPSRARFIFLIRDEVQDFFENYIIKLDGTEKINDADSSIEKYKNNISITNMIKVVKIIKKYLQEKFGEQLLLENTEGLLIDEFIVFIKNKLTFACVSSDTREQAFRLFTILNNRGIPLTTADILKSLNLDKVPDEIKRNEYAKKWEELEEKFEDKFDRFLNFIRTIKLKEKARKNLLEEFEEKIYKEKIMNYGKESIDYFLNTSDNYDRIIELNYNLENIPSSYKNLIKLMKAGFNSEDWIPPLLYYYEKFNLKDIDKFLKLLDNKFMGDWINKETPTKRLENMNKILKAIEIASAETEILNNKELFTFDIDIFKSKINGNIYGERYCKYLLLKIEYLKLDNDIEYNIGASGVISIEHVLPQNPKEDSDWKIKFSDDERNEWTNKLGNLILLTKRKNSKLSNSDFKEKSKIYKNSNMLLFPSVFEVYSNGEDWNVDILKTRQEEIINLLIKGVIND